MAFEVLVGVKRSGRISFYYTSYLIVKRRGEYWADSPLQSGDDSGNFTEQDWGP
jgi:hypothetical protein